MRVTIVSGIYSSLRFPRNINRTFPHFYLGISQRESLNNLRPSPLLPRTLSKVSGIRAAESERLFYSDKMAAYTLVLVRHGESVWNQKNLFCGWYDADLSETGVNEAIAAGKMLKEKKYSFDIAFTSVLKRAIKTLYYIQNETDHHWIPVIRHWRLNERHYGGLQGLNKAETAAKYGDEQVKIWRRSYDTPPPALTEKDEHWSAKDRKYRDLDKSVIPPCECLKDTVNRVLPFWYDNIVPAIKSGKKVIISAHGNSLRALVKYLDNMSDAEIPGLNIPTGIPLVYQLDKDLKPVKHFYLADEAQVKAAMEKVANQGKAKK